MSHCVDDCYDVYNEVRVRARKAHRCAACKETISAGHRYMRIGCVFDGAAYTIKRCLRCQAIHEHLRTLDEWNETWPDERLDCGEEYRAHWGEDPPPEIAALAFASSADLQEEEP